MLESWNEDAARLMDQARELLALDEITLTDEMIGKLRFHVELIQQWNPIVGVVSKGDVHHLWERHVVDSLRVAAVIKRLGLHEGHLLDIGSGGGFPAVPIKVALPSLTVKFLERSSDKLGFLRKVVAVLPLQNCHVIAGNFPEISVGHNFDVVTARAVENSSHLRDKIKSLGLGKLLIIQHAKQTREGNEVIDCWPESLRRSKLWIMPLNP